MTNEQQVSSLTLSQRLKELGVKQESLFCWYYIDAPTLYAGPELGYTGYDLPSETSEVISAFTVAELGEMLPEKYVSIKDKGEFKCMHKTEDGWERVSSSETEADTRAKMLIYLLENDLM